MTKSTLFFLTITLTEAEVGETHILHLYCYETDAYSSTSSKYYSIFIPYFRVYRIFNTSKSNTNKQTKLHIYSSCSLAKLRSIPYFRADFVSRAKHSRLGQWSETLTHLKMSFNFSP